MPNSPQTTALTTPLGSTTGGRGRPHQSALSQTHVEPEKSTPCRYEPERWHPDEQKPDPTAVAACWSCHFQPQCALRALVNKESFGVWGGYRLAPGPGLARSRKQLAIIAGMEMGPAASPGVETVAVLDAGFNRQPGSIAQVITLSARQPPARHSNRMDIAKTHNRNRSQVQAHAG